jgi:hypothetical protein
MHMLYYLRMLLNVVIRLMKEKSLVCNNVTYDLVALYLDVRLGSETVLYN